MLVQKKSQKKNLMLGGTLVVLIGVTAFVLLRGSGNPGSDLSNLGLNNQGVVVQPAVVDIDSAFFGKKEIVGLKDRSGQGHTDQSLGVPTDYQVTPAPIGAYVLNPQVGEKLILYWDFNDRYTAVKIYRAEIQSEKGELIAEISDKNYYQDVGITNGVYYYYTLIAIGANGQESDESIKLTGSPNDIFPPQKPTGVAVVNAEDGKQIKISWVPPQEKDFAYVKIYRSQIEGELGLPILDKAVENNYYIDESVLENVEYYYTITSVDTSGNESEKSILPVGGNKNPFNPSF
ncbi:MAG: hypothetical protein WCT33_00555 [Patescibacteria group bacterium]